MRNLFLLLVLVICAAAYVRAQQLATWNSWMAILGASDLAIAATPPTPDTADVPAALPTPVAPPQSVGVPPVGGRFRNGNFVAGKGYWEGDGTADPSGRGLVIKLSPTTWTCVYQTFADPGTENVIEVTYKFSLGLTFSGDPADYTEIGKRVQIPGFGDLGSYPITPGHLIGVIGAPGAFSLCEYSPPFGSTDIQVYKHEYPATPASGNTTWTLAFPPGGGTVTLLTAFLMSR